jgi:predicted enzyme related to lactoylglutathione lyase
MSSAKNAHGLVIFASDKAKVSLFYQQVLGMQVVESFATHDLLCREGLEVVVHAIPQSYAGDTDVKNPPEPRSDTPIKPIFTVPDLQRTYLLANEVGGFLKPLNEAWQYRGYLVLDGCDPEGNVVQFRQRALPLD